MTTNHDYTTPEEGAIDWHVPLNANFERLDTDVEIRDVAANRSNYDPVDGAKFFATDTGEIAIGDGTAWQDLGSVRGVTVGSTEPSDPSEGDLWIDTS